MPKAKYDYMALLSCRTPEEVHALVRSLTSNLTDQEHEVRSMIFDIQSGVESRLKRLLVIVLTPLLWNAGGTEFAEHRKKLDDAVEAMSFSQVHRLLKPLFDAFPGPDLGHAEEINNLRNQVPHDSDVSRMFYKGRNPFRDVDCLAQLFLDWQGFSKEIRHFHERMIGDPQYEAAQDAEFRRKYEAKR